MVTKTDRILSYLPSTFRTEPPAPVLKQLIETFGQELLVAENNLAEILAAHFVDYADRGAPEIDDLARLAALYGLAPRREADLSGRELGPDEARGAVIESVEAFRERLKRYIRTFLEGTVTVQGNLRVAAEALALEIADAPEDLDGWWNRQESILTTTTPRCEDATKAVFGHTASVEVGQAAQAAQIIGQTSLPETINLQGANQLRLRVDGDLRTIDLLPEQDSEQVSKDTIVDTINAAFDNLEIARLQGQDDDVLVLASPTLGPSSQLVLVDGDNDAALSLLGLVPYDYRGTEAQPAQVVGQNDLPTLIDLSQQRYLRLELDRNQTVEIDCANPADPTQTTPEQVQTAINQALGAEVASLAEHRLVLTSPTVGFNSSLALQQPAAQDATETLLGDVERFYLGQEAQPAQVQGRQDLSPGVDLSLDSHLQFRVDGGGSITVDCAGETPEDTQLFEIVTAINTAFGAEIARQDGQFLSLASSTVGADSRLVLESLVTGDAIASLLGLPPRTASGQGATAAQLTYTPKISDLVDLAAPNSLFLGRLNMAVDGGSPVEIPLRIEITAPGTLAPSTLQNQVLSTLTAAINQVYPNVAGHNRQQLTLTSGTLGSASRLELFPLETIQQRPFVTRAAVLNDAVVSVFGFIQRQVQGSAATTARLVGTVDVSRGKDLSVNRYLRIRLDDETHDVDCAGLRPRVTSLEEIINAINQQVGSEIASPSGRNLMLTSTTKGTNGRIALEPPQSTDALPALGLSAGSAVRGQDATRVTLVGTVDLSSGIDLPADAQVRLKIDQADPVDILLTAEAARLNLDQVLLAINQQLDQVVAQTDGQHLILSSSQSGTGSIIAVEAASGSDVTTTLLGIPAPRHYQGQAPLAAEIIGDADLSAPLDLSTRRFLNITVDNQPAQVVDCAATATDPTAVTLAELEQSINQAFGDVTIATIEANRLVLRSPTLGLGSRILLSAHSSNDATELLFGDSERQVQGREATPAILTGATDLTTSVDLSEGSQIRLIVEDHRPVDIDVVGAAPANTFGDEIAAAINTVYPGMAEITNEGKLQLTAPTAGENSHLAVSPQRYLELVEYLPTSTTSPKPEESPRLVRHGDRWLLQNDSAIDALATVQIRAPQGVVGPTLVNQTLGWQLRVLTLVDAGDILTIKADDSSIHAYILSISGSERRIEPTKILVGPIGTQVFVPFDGAYGFRQDGRQQATLQLNSPWAAQIVRLRAPADVADDLTLTVKSHHLQGAVALPEADEQVKLLGRLQLSPEPVLLDGNNNEVVRLRPGSGVNFARYPDQVVTVTGPLYGDQPAVLEVNDIYPLFDVTVSHQPDGELPTIETFTQVTIGIGDALALSQQINTASQWLTAELLDKTEALSLPKGVSEWVYLDCYSSRFNYANFDQARFVGERCLERGIFNVSRFLNHPPEMVEAVFTSLEASSDPPVEVTFAWLTHQAGSFEVHLPADLPERFGGRFNQTRLSQRKGKPEVYTKAVTELTGDEEFDNEHYLVRLMESSTLVTAEEVDRVPLGWQPVAMPFRRPQLLTLGSRDTAAQIYLTEPGFDNFIKLEANHIGTWGNEITVSARSAGSAMYDVEIAYQASRFENARQVVLGPPLPTLAQSLLKPTPIGILQAKAAGVRATVTRDTCIPP